jgi:hypothetical protein
MDRQLPPELGSLIDGFPGTAEQREALRKKALGFIEVNGPPPYPSSETASAFAALVFDPAILPGKPR